jgi:N,N'-diacetyllegionaminate synthase
MLKEITQQKVFIIAEAGVNHNGDLALARQLVEAAKKTGADAVKFQTWKTENIIVKGTDKAEYQKVDGEEDQFEMLKKLEFPYDDFLKLKEYAAQVGILLFSTPDDEESMEFLVHKMQVPLLKVGSAELTNLPHLQKMASYHLPLIISTGMATLSEVREAVRAIEAAWPKPDLAILQCTSSYPAVPEGVNLRVIETYQKEFPEYVIGFSDHTVGGLAAVLSVALGARILEKHFTLDNSLPGPDHQASLNPADFTRMVDDIRLAEVMLGSREKKPTSTEMEVKKVVERFLLAARDIEAGELIGADMVVAKRTSAQGGLSVSELSSILSKKTTQRIPKDHVITHADVEA